MRHTKNDMIDSSLGSDETYRGDLSGYDADSDWEPEYDEEQGGIDDGVL